MKRALIFAVAATLSFSLMTVADALWQATTNPAGLAAARASTLPAGNEPKATVTPPTGSDVLVSWVPSTGGAPVSGYEVRSYEASSGTPRTVGSNCAGVIAGTSCTETGVPARTWRYSVVPRLASWFGVESTRSNPVTVDPAPPTVTITFPSAGGIYATRSWNLGCSSQICGTAADTDSGVASVQVSVRQSSGNYWNGTAFASATEVLLSATGTTSWTLDFPAANFPADGAYTVRAVATDGVGGTGSTSRTFTIDRSAPTVAITFPTNGTTYGTSSWNAGCTSRICGTAADTGSGVASVRVSIRQGSGDYWNGTAFASATEVLLTATGTTSWTLDFPAANFPADGSYTVRAVPTDGAGNTGTASSSATLDVTRPTPSALSLFDGDGLAEPTIDEVRITFSEVLSVSSVCSTWSGTGDQTLGDTGTVVTVTNNGTNDTLTVTASGCTLNVGPVATGRDYVTATSTFRGSGASESRVTWTASTRVLTIHFGALAGGTLNSTQPAGTATYTPHASITDAAGNPVITTPFSATNQRF